MLVEFIRRKAFSKLIPVESGRIVALDKAKNVGIVVDASEPEMMIKLNGFISFLRNRLIDMQILCIDLKGAPVDSLTQMHTVSELTVVLPSNIPHAKVGIPNYDSIRIFAEREFDMLIDLTGDSRSVTSDYIVAASRSTMKVRVGRGGSVHYDVEFSPTEGLPADEQVAYVINYLSSF